MTRIVPADVHAALVDGVGQGGGGGAGHVVARVARVDDVRRVLGDRRPAGGDREDTADSEAGGAVAKNRAAFARALRAGQTGPGKVSIIFFQIALSNPLV